MYYKFSLAIQLVALVLFGQTLAMKTRLRGENQAKANAMEAPPAVELV